MQHIYENGARKFWIYNSVPLGCLPWMLASRKENDSMLDVFEWMTDYYNVALSDLCEELVSEVNVAQLSIQIIIPSDTILLLIIPIMVSHFLLCSLRYNFRLINWMWFWFLFRFWESTDGRLPYNYRDLMTSGQPTASPCRGLVICELGWSSQHRSCQF